MKKITYLLCMGLMAAGLIFLDTGCTVKAKKAYHEKRADKFFAAGDWDKAEIEYLNTFRYDGQDARAASQLGKIYFDEGRLRRALYFLSRATELATNDIDVRLKLGFLQSAVGSLPEARDTANFVLNQRPQDDQAALLLSEAADNPAEVLKAKLRLQKLAAAGNRASLEIAQGNLALRSRDFKTAEADFRRAISLDPKSPEAENALGAWCWSQNDLKDAESYFKDAADSSPLRSPWRMQYARFKIQTGDMTGAQAVLEEIVKGVPQQVPALMGLATIFLEQKKYDDSEKYLAKVLALEPDDFDALLLNGQLQIARGDAPAAVATMQRVTGVYPKAVRGFYQLALAYFAAGNADQGAANLEQAVNLDPNFNDAVLLLAEVKIKMGDPNRALILLQQLAKSQPQLVQGRLLLADAQRELGHLPEALAVYTSLEKSFPENAQIQLLKGSTLVELKDYNGARQAFNRVREIDTNSFPALEQLVYLDLRDQQFTGAQKRIQNELAKKPDSVGLYLLLARVFLYENDRAQAEATLQKTIAISPNDPNAYLLLAQSYFDAGRTEKALQMFNTVTQKDPRNIVAWMGIATIQNAQKNYDKASSAYEKVLTVNPNFSQALNNLAYLYSENLNQPDRAYELAKRARAQLPFDASTADTLGWVLVKRGDYQVALGLLQSAVAKMPEDPDVEFHFGLANYMLDNEAAAGAAFQHALQTGKEFPGHAEAQLCTNILAINPQTADDNTRAFLEKRISEKPNDLVVLNRLATIYQRDGKLDKAISANETILQADKNNISSMIKLVQLYTANHDATKAYDLAQAAYQIAPNNPEVTHLLGQFVFQAGDYKTAMALLSQTVRRQPDNASAQFDYARAAYSLGKIPETQTALQTALPNLTGASAAEAMRMNDLINLTMNPPQIPAAATRIAEILKTEPNYVPALDVQEMIQEQSGDLAAAKTTGEKILETYPDFAPGQKQLARLYTSDPNKLDRAYILAIKARANFPTDPELAKTYGIILYQQKNYSRALEPLAQSAAQMPKDGEVFFYIGSAQFQLKRPEAKATLKQALALKLTPEQMDAAKKMLVQLK